MLHYDMPTRLKIIKTKKNKIDILKIQNSNLIKMEISTFTDLSTVGYIRVIFIMPMYEYNK